jgi:hypothetical protein
MPQLANGHREQLSQTNAGLDIQTADHLAHDSEGSPKFLRGFERCHADVQHVSISCYLSRCLTALICPQKFGSPFRMHDRSITSLTSALEIHSHSKRKRQRNAENSTSRVTASRSGSLFSGPLRENLSNTKRTILSRSSPRSFLVLPLRRSPPPRRARTQASLLSDGVSRCGRHIERQHSERNSPMQECRVLNPMAPDDEPLCPRYHRPAQEYCRSRIA